MSNKTIPIPKSYLEKIIKPVSRITESCILKTNKDVFYTVCSSIDNSVILYAKTILPIEIDEAIKLNIISIPKFLTGLKCLGSDGEFTIKTSTNNIVCQNVNGDNEKTHFTYHLVDDSVIKECTIQPSKFSMLDFNTVFVITSEKAKQVLSASSFATDASKVYFFIDDEENICAKIDDETLQNIDNITIPLTKTYEGEPITESFPISLEIFKNLAAIKNDVTVKINNKFKLIIFQVTDEDAVELKYIVSALIK